MKINQYCACDMDNFGDVLYPILFKHVSHGILGKTTTDAHAFIPGQAAMGGGYEVRSIRELFASDLTRLPLVIGGGDILRFDDRMLAFHYTRQMAPPRTGWGQTVQQGPYRVTYRYGDATPQLDPVEVFVRDKMPPVRGAFMLSPQNCPGAKSVAYFSAGVPFEFQREEWPHVREVFNAASFIYLRDAQSAEKLRRAGVTRDIEVAPDIAVLISDLFPKTALAEIAHDLLSGIGVSVDQPYLCIQLSEAATPALTSIASQLHVFAKRHNVPVVLLPLGFCHGDVAILSRLSEAYPHHFKLAHVKTIREMLAILSHAEAFAGVSMHGNICAFSYGVPHLFGALNVDKIGGAMVSMGVDENHRIGDWSELLQGLEGLMQVDRLDLAKKQAIASQRAYLASDRLLKALIA